jgi:hypothetical protein
VQAIATWLCAVTKAVVTRRQTKATIAGTSLKATAELDNYPSVVKKLVGWVIAAWKEST